MSILLVLKFAKFEHIGGVGPCKTCLEESKTLLISYEYSYTEDTHPEIIFIREVMIPEYSSLLEEYNSRPVNVPNILNIFSEILNNINTENVISISLNEEQKRPTANKEDIDKLKIEKWNPNIHSDTCLFCQTEFKEMKDPNIIQCCNCQTAFCAGCNEKTDDPNNIDCKGLYRWLQEADVCPHCNAKIEDMIPKKQKII